LFIFFFILGQILPCHFAASLCFDKFLCIYLNALIYVFGINFSTHSNACSLSAFILSIFFCYLGILVDLAMAHKSFFNASHLWSAFLKFWIKCLTQNLVIHAEWKKQKQRDKRESRMVSPTVGRRIILPRALMSLRRVHRACAAEATWRGS
jgi:hypothetical protein